MRLFLICAFCFFSAFSYACVHVNSTTGDYTVDRSGSRKCEELPDEVRELVERVDRVNFKHYM